MEMLLEVILIILGLYMLAKGADFLVEGSSIIARRFKIPEIIIGLTIVSIGTSLPELMISATSSLKGSSDISIGNVIGSNFANLFLIIALCSLIRPLHIKKQSRFVDQPIVVFCTALLYYVAHNDGAITQYEGIAMLLITVLYLLYNIEMTIYGKKLNQYESPNDVDEKKDKGLLKGSKIGNKIYTEKSKLAEKFPAIYSILCMVFGLLFLKIGGDITVDSARLVALALGFSEKIIGLTIVAIGTSLPELITGVEATRKGAADLAIGNIAGSQIFNILLILGVASTIRPIYGADGFKEEILILLVGNIIFAIAPFISDRHRVGRFFGISFIAIYFAYMIMIMTEQLANQF